MCGISGKLNWNVPPSVVDVEAMNARQVHRGPDGGGTKAIDSVVFGHRRLSIIDLSDAGLQPMYDHTGSFLITFNGEIYNYLELRADLIARGSKFTSRTDTEVILEAYKAWGPDCVKKFNGMFAFAIWDGHSKALFLARDRLGKKPLFYHLRNDGISFASELPALMQDPEVPEAINDHAVIQYLAIGYVTGAGCIYSGIRKLPPGSWLRWTKGSEPIAGTYWNLASKFLAKDGPLDETSAAHQLNELLDDAVKIRLMSDVPLGAFLSGGVDSSSIVAGLRKFRSKELAHTFSVGFHEKSFNELDEAQSAAEALGVTHHASFIPESLFADLHTIANCSGEPFADTSIIPMYFLSQFARTHVTVCLSGDGADEIFAGYETYVADRLHNVIRHVPSPLLSITERIYRRLSPRNFGKVSLDYKILQFLKGASFAPARAHYTWRELFSEEELQGLLLPEFRGKIAEASPLKIFEAFDREVSSCHFLDRAMYVDIKTWLADDILVKVDRATMAHSLEARAPFLDYRLVEFAASLPTCLKLNGLSKKYILRRSQRERLPAAILKRPKKGFNAPISHWLFESMKQVSRDIERESPVLDYINPSTYKQLLLDHLNRRADNSFRLFAIINLHYWLTHRKQNLLKRAA